MEWIGCYGNRRIEGRVMRSWMGRLYCGLETLKLSFTLASPAAS